MMWIYLHMNDGGAGVCEYGWRTRYTYWLGWPPNSCKEAWRKCAHMTEDLREGGSAMSMQEVVTRSG
jgi:hypothetical protein